MKLNGSKGLVEYTLIHRELEQTQRDSAGVVFMIDKKQKGNIGLYKYINERILKIRCKICRDI